MTSKIAPKTRHVELDGIDKFPEFPPRDDMQNTLYLYDPAHQSALRVHFGASDNIIVLGEVPVGNTARQRRGIRVPDLLIAFNIDRPYIIAQMGYSIADQGKPPDFVLEVASVHTAQNDYTWKRVDYANFGIPEYWRFDPTGGRRYDRALAGDRLVDGNYQPIPIVQGEEAHQWGHSAVLGLDVCWEEGQLRWYDPLAGSYLRTFDEEAQGRIAAEDERDSALQERNVERIGRLTAEDERDTERRGRLAAEERMRELEAELRRLRG